MPSKGFNPVEKLSGAVPIIETEHGLVHAGTHFTATHQVSVGTGTAVTVLITTPAEGVSKYLHFVFAVNADKAVTWTFSEAPNASGGTAVVSYNNNRNSANTSGTVITHSVSYTSSGTILESGQVGAGSNPATTTGGGANARNEWLLLPGATYLIRVVALNAGTNVTVTLPYYYRPSGVQG